MTGSARRLRADPGLGVPSAALVLAPRRSRGAQGALREAIGSGGGPRVDLQHPAGAVADVFSPNGNHLGLAEQAFADQERGATADEVGWVADERLMQGVWGRAWSDKGPTAFQVLVHRIRKDLARVGLTSSIIEKRSGFTRIRPDAVELVPVNRS